MVGVLGGVGWLEHALTLDKDDGWGWNKSHAEYYSGAALVAPKHFILGEGMMAGIYLGGGYTKSATVDSFSY